MVLGSSEPVAVNGIRPVYWNRHEPSSGVVWPELSVSSIFNPLWALAASIDDPVQAHRISTAFVFILYAVTIWFVATRLIETKVFVLFSVVVCLNLFFHIVPVTESYPLP